jgi:hypothetical protein
MSKLRFVLAGSFPSTFSQCLREMGVSGCSSRKSFLPSWVSFENPTQLFQLFMGDGQHAFSAHGRWNSRMFEIQG